jgi:glycine betaine/choline ABC-type transport system substrate-binding protein
MFYSTEVSDAFYRAAYFVDRTLKGSRPVALERLSGRVSAADMRAMNYAADVEHRDVARIVADFLQAKKSGQRGY